MVQTSTVKTPRKPRTVKHPESKSAASDSAPAKTKQQQLQERLEAPDGASLQQLSEAFGWQAHTVRAAISGLRKAGHDVQRGTVERASVYRIVTAGQG